MIIRPIDPQSAREIELVASRMRATLMEVLDPARGEAMYTIEWLDDRVRQHLDGRHVGAVFVAEDDGEIVGHTIVRIEHDTERVVRYPLLKFVIDCHHFVGWVSFRIRGKPFDSWTCSIHFIP